MNVLDGEERVPNPSATRQHRPLLGNAPWSQFLVGSGGALNTLPKALPVTWLGSKSATDYATLANVSECMHSGGTPGAKNGLPRNFSRRRGNKSLTDSPSESTIHKLEER